MVKSNEGLIRYKMLNGKKVSVCDYEGKCKNKVYGEIYPLLLGGKHKNRDWTYLCRKHFEQEQKKFKKKLAYCALD